MNGDLRFFRRRWWGAWVLMLTVLVVLSICLAFAMDPSTSRGGISQLAGVLIFGGCCTLLLLGCYAPWTFLWAFRVLGGAVLALYLAYFVDEARNQHWFTAGRSSHSAFNAIRGLVAFGIPGFLLMIMRRPAVCPYDDLGRPIPIEMLRTLRLHTPQKVGRTVWEPVLRAQIGSLALSRRDRRRVEANWESEEPELRLRLSIRPEGESLLGVVRAQLDERGITYDVGPEEPADATYRSLFERILSRTHFG